jgi:glucose/arabinose dehydrogenase
VESAKRYWLIDNMIQEERSMRRISCSVLVVAAMISGAGWLEVTAQGQRGAPGGAPGGGPGGGRGGPPPAVQLNTIRMPPGFAIDLYAEGVQAARSMALGDNGTVFVGTFGLLTGQQNVGKVFAVRDTNGDGRGDQVLTIAEGLNQPNGVAFRNGALYVAEMHRIVRYDDIERRLANPPAPVVVKDGFMNSGNHQWRYIAFGPDGKLYIALGAPCNVCKADEPYASIARMNPDGSAFEIYARGVRNSVGLAFHPGNGQLWFTDNGRDLLGDNLPSDEVNHASQAGQHFGFPACHQGEVIDKEFGSAGACQQSRAPAVKLGPHVAALGLRFYTGMMFPAEYRGELFIAQHGSWNRSNPLGYRIGLVHIHDGQFASGQRIFAEGWLQGRQPWGRPADLLVLADGSMLVSDDLQGKIYRVTYRAP